MKIKFLSKKQRDQLRKQKENDQSHKPSELYSNGNKDQITTEYSTIKQQYQSQHARIHQNTPEPAQKQSTKQQNKKDKQENHKQTDKQRQRSRQKKLKQKNILTSQEIKQREVFKNKYLGLVKTQKSKRNIDMNYKNKLLFEWDDSQDTFQQSGYLGKTIMSAASKFAQKNLDPIAQEKVYSWKNKKLEQMTERDWRIFRQDNQIYVKGGRVPDPIREWKDCDALANNKQILENFRNLKYEKPRPIQMQAIPIGLHMKDLIAIAPTGQGKTLGYLIPIINFILPLERIIGINSQKGPYALILAPSRELAEQIQEQFKKITEGLMLEVIRLVGGKQIQLQSLNLSKGADIIIGTPGRVKQMIEKRYLSLQRLSWVVIDEADKMISENLVEQVSYILDNSSSESVLPEQLRRDKIIHMFSATMVPQIEKMVKSYLMPNASYITIGEPGGGKKQIEQFVQLIPQDSKNQKLARILKNLPGPIIIFVSERQRCGVLTKQIQMKLKRSVADYHGGKSQEVREKIISNFRSGKIQILVATDLAGRGLDVKGINAVINYDAPKNISQFIHRAGRTGRAGMKGKCFTLLTAADQNIFYDVRIFLQRNQFKVPQNLRNHPAAIVKPGTVLSVPRRKQIVYTN